MCIGLIALHMMTLSYLLATANQNGCKCEQIRNNHRLKLVEHRDRRPCSAFRLGMRVSPLAFLPVMYQQNTAVS